MRRQIRLRREFLYRKSLEGKEKEVYEQKRRIREALREGKAIPTELTEQAMELKKEIDMEDDRTMKPRATIDDEYASAGVTDPKICISTSRSPSSRLKQFVKELRLVFPNSQRFNRGNHTIGELVEAGRSAEFSDMVLVHETRGNPDGMVITHLPYGPTAFFNLSNTVMRHDIEFKDTMSEAYPHLIFEGLRSPLGERLMTVLKHLFPVPKPDSKRVMTFSNTSDVISFRHHTFSKTGKEVELSEVGPRFDMQLYQLRLGTVDQTEAKDEWVLRPYMTTARKRKAL